MLGIAAAIIVTVLFVNKAKEKHLMTWIWGILGFLSYASTYVVLPYVGGYFLPDWDWTLQSDSIAVALIHIPSGLILGIPGYILLSLQKAEVDQDDPNIPDILKPKR